MKWDYGKSTYRVISAAEAIELVKQDKHNLQKLRLLFPNDELLEYEVRDNGAVYAIYGNPGRCVSMNVGDEVKEYKNMRYVPWKVALLNATKIYLTDEYEHPVSAEKKIERNEKEVDLTIFDKHLFPGDDDYDPHKPAYNFTKPGTASHQNQKSVPDTGAHTRGYSETAEAFQKYSYCRLALKKLEREQADLDADDYEYQKNRLTSKLARLKKEYDDLCKQKKQESDHTVQRIWKDAEDSNNLLVNYLTNIERALNMAYSLKRSLETIEAQTPLERARMWDAGLLKSDIEDWKNTVEELEKTNKHLEELKQDLPADTENLRNEVTNSIASDQERLEKKIHEYSEKYEIANQKLIKQVIRRLSDLNKQLKDAQAEIMRLRPNTTAKKAAKKNAEASLDSSLTDILDFVDFIPKTEEAR